MNPERQRQHEESKARKSRLGAYPVCRAVTVGVVKERPRLPRGARPPQRAETPEIFEAIEREHQVRVRCVREAYAAEKDRHRAVFAATIRECIERETTDLAELLRYRANLLAEARKITRAKPA